MQMCAMNGDKEGVSRNREEFKDMLHSYGIKMGAQYLPLTQVPFLISFFLILRQMSNSVADFPRMQTDGFL